MKKLLLTLGFVALLITAKAYACVTQTYIIDGKMITCTTCGTVTNCF